MSIFFPLDRSVAYYRLPRTVAQIPVLETLVGASRARNVGTELCKSTIF